MLQTHSFYSLLYHVGIVPFAADESYEAVILDDRCAALLGVPSGSCALDVYKRQDTGIVYHRLVPWARGGSTGKDREKPAAAKKQ